MKKLGSMLIVEETDIFFSKESFTKFFNQEGILNQKLINQIWKDRPSSYLDEKVLKEMIHQTLQKDTEYCKLIVPWWKLHTKLIMIIFVISLLLFVVFT